MNALRLEPGSGVRIEFVVDAVPVGGSGPGILKSNLPDAVVGWDHLLLVRRFAVNKSYGSRSWRAYPEGGAVPSPDCTKEFILSSVVCPHLSPLPLSRPPSPKGAPRFGCSRNRYSPSMSGRLAASCTLIEDGCSSFDHSRIMTSSWRSTA